MKILVIIGDCIQRNSSANLCHIAYLKGMVDLGYEVTLLSEDGRDYKTDSSIVIPEGIICHLYYAVTLYERLSLKKKKAQGQSFVRSMQGNTNESSIRYILKKCINSVGKKALLFYGPYGTYSKFAKKARKFSSKTEYDYILSISAPTVSHLLAHELLKRGRIKGKHWIQIWEDPWYCDVYGYHNKQEILAEEERLLSFAERVCYVSPLTLKKQQEIFPASAHKMYWEPLPYYYKDASQKASSVEKNIYGYFGDYVPISRNLKPFYEAAKEEKIEVNICGNPNTLFETTDLIHIYPRMQLRELKPIEDKTTVLIFLCNRIGGQIPGKIYQYSATYKTILFILDGTVEEQNTLRHYFEQFDRYVFCKNTKEDIAKAIKKVEEKDFQNAHNRPVEYFSPANIISNILKE